MAGGNRRARWWEVNISNVMLLVVTFMKLRLMPVVQCTVDLQHLNMGIWVIVEKN